MNAYRKSVVPVLVASIVLAFGAITLGAIVAAAQDSPEAEPDLALNGLDPVLLTGGEEVEGREDLNLARGRFLYRFASEETRERFAAEPERYEIQLDGHCAVMPSAKGWADLFAVHEGKIYIFGSEGCRKEFLDDPAKFREGESRIVAILLYEGVELLDFAGPGEVFAAAARGQNLEVYTVAASAEPVESQGFVTVTPNHTLASSPRPDILVVPGGGVRHLLGDEAAMQWIRKVAEDAEVVLSVCNGAIVLGKAGLLDGKGATTHRGSLDDLRRTAPAARVYDDRRFVDNGRIVTAAGVSAGIDAALHIVSRLFGAPHAQRVATYMEYAWRPGDAEPDPEARTATR